MCSERHQVIGYVNEYIPVLTGLDETGVVLWHVRFADQNRTPIEAGLSEEGRERVTFRAPGSGESTGLKVFSDSSMDSFIASYLTVGTDSKTDLRHYYRIDVTSGLGEYLGQQRPEYIAARPRELVALDAEFAYTLQRSPYPEIGIHTRRAIFP